MTKDEILEVARLSKHFGLDDEREKEIEMRSYGFATDLCNYFFSALGICTLFWWKKHIYFYYPFTLLYAIKHFYVFLKLKRKRDIIFSIVNIFCFIFWTHMIIVRY